jgi:hypothetical protein
VHSKQQDEEAMIDLKSLRNLDREDLLNLIGLEPRRTPSDWILPAVGVFSVGMLVGAGLGMLLAPKSGRELMDDLRTRLQGETGELGTGTYEPRTNSGLERSPRSV